MSQTLINNFLSFFSSAENYTEMDSCIQCDGVMSMKSMSEKCCQITAANGYTEKMYHSTYHSQPQESEWND